MSYDWFRFFGAQVHRVTWVGLTNNNSYCVHKEKNRAIEILHSEEEAKKKISTVYKKCINWYKKLATVLSESIVKINVFEKKQIRWMNERKEGREGKQGGREGGR